VRLNTPLPPPRLLDARKWIDVNLTFQVVTAYEGDTPVHWARTSTGRPGWETPTGMFTINRRVEKEVMDSQSLLGRDAERAEYRVEDVRWVQYFTSDGAAFHENYWKPPDTFGIPSSHGCVGLLANDAEWLWSWAGVGTPVFVHH
jgi:lipoprotein-anchoring transpeptidase ErfK/SrfK